MDTSNSKEEIEIDELLEPYENLIRDLLTELESQRKAFKKLISSEEHLNSKSSLLSSGRKELTCQKCNHLEKIIKNLSCQLEICQNSKKATEDLWRSSIEQIETLEDQIKQSKQSGGGGGGGGIFSAKTSSTITTNENNLQLITDLKKRSEYLEECVKRVNEQLEITGKERSFYRNKLMEISVDFENKLESNKHEKKLEIERAKGEFIKEIEYLKKTIENLRVENRKNLEIKLVEEREILKKEESKKIAELKETFLLKIEPFILDQEALIEREKHLTLQNESLIIENERLKSKIIILHREFNSEISHIPVKLNDNSNHPEKIVVSQGQVSVKKGGKQLEKIEEEDSSLIDYDENNNNNNNNNKSLKEIGKYRKLSIINNFEELRRSKVKLEEEHMNLIDEKKKYENETFQVISRLEGRIKELELNNIDLHRKFGNGESLLESHHHHHPCQNYQKREIKLKDIQTNTNGINFGLNNPIELPKDGKTQIECKEECLLIKSTLKNLETKYKYESQRWKLREFNLLEKIKKLDEEQAKLLKIANDERTVMLSWRSEYKDLLEKTEKLLLR